MLSRLSISTTKATDHQFDRQNKLENRILSLNVRVLHHRLWDVYTIADACGVCFTRQLISGITSFLVPKKFIDSRGVQCRFASSLWNLRVPLKLRCFCFDSLGNRNYTLETC